MGNRFAGGIEPGAMPAVHRYLGNPVLSFLGRRFFRVPIHDFHCGMRGFRRERVLDLGLCTGGMEFASEMVVRASLAGLDIAEVPTTLRPAGRSRPPHLRTWRDGWRHLRFLLAFSPRWLFLYPALAPHAGGSVAFLALWSGPVRIGDLAFDVQTMMLAATAIIVGLQAGGLALVSPRTGSASGCCPAATGSSVSSTASRSSGACRRRGHGTGRRRCFVAAAWRWSGTDFGRLSTDDMRVPVLGMLLVVAGAQVVLVSFLLSLTRIGETTQTTGLGPADREAAQVRT